MHNTGVSNHAHGSSRPICVWYTTIEFSQKKGYKMIYLIAIVLFVPMTERRRPRGLNLDRMFQKNNHSPERLLADLR